MATLNQVIHQPEAGWRRIDDFDKLISWEGGIEQQSGTKGDCWKKTRTWLRPGGSKGTFTTNASKLRILGSHLDYSRSPKTEVHVNGIKVGEFTQITKTNPSIDGKRLSYEIEIGDSSVKEIAIINSHTSSNPDDVTVIDCIDIDSNAILLPELSKDYEFPVKIGNLADVETYSSSLIGGEEQLLITREGSLYLTDGNGSYKAISEDVDLSNYYNKEEVDNLIAIVEPPAGATHTHANTDTLINLGNSAGMLTYGGKVVVNNNEYSFRTLPRAKVITNYSTEKGGRLPWLQ